MYGMIKFPDWEIRKETKYGKLKYYYKEQKMDEDELQKYIDSKKIKKAKSIFIHNTENEYVIMNSLFSNDEDLISIIIPEGVTNINAYSFYECTGLKKVIIPSSVTNIDFYTFRGCKKLTNVTISEGVTNIEDSAFEDCINLTNITIPKSVTNIGYCAFHRCPNLKEVMVQNKDIRIEKDAFDKDTKIIIKEEEKDLDTIIKECTVNENKNIDLSQNDIIKD